MSASDVGGPDDTKLEIAKAALALSSESLQKQQADVRELRVVAGMLLTGTSVAASFLGGRALDSGQLFGLPGLGLAFFVGSLLAIIRVLLPGLPFDPEKRLQETSGGAAILELRDPDATDSSARHEIYVIGRWQRRMTSSSRPTTGLSGDWAPTSGLRARYCCWRWASGGSRSDEPGRAGPALQPPSATVTAA